MPSQVPVLSHLASSQGSRQAGPFGLNSIGQVPGGNGGYTRLILDRRPITKALYGYQLVRDCILPAKHSDAPPLRIVTVN